MLRKNFPNRKLSRQQIALNNLINNRSIYNGILNEKHTDERKQFFQNKIDKCNNEIEILTGKK